MTLQIDYISRIRKSTGEIIFEFPSKTLLDGILLDLWQIISNYHICSKPFIIGKCNKEYLNYRQVTSHDFSVEKNKKLFIDYYQNNKFFCDDLNNIRALRGINCFINIDDINTDGGEFMKLPYLFIHNKIAQC